MSKFPLLVSTVLLRSTSLLPAIAIAAPKWVKIITDEDVVQNFVDKASIRSNKTSRNYTSARTVRKAVTSDEEMPLRRPNCRPSEGEGHHRSVVGCLVAKSLICPKA